MTKEQKLMFTLTNQCRMNTPPYVCIYTRTHSPTHFSRAPAPCSITSFPPPIPPLSNSSRWRACVRVRIYNIGYRNDITAAVWHLGDGEQQLLGIKSSQWQPGGEVLTVSSVNRSTISTACSSPLYPSPRGSLAQAWGIHHQATCIYS